MAEPTNEPAPPTYFANAVSVQINSDEVSIEFRRLMPSHAEFARLTKDGTQAAPLPTAEQFYAIPPITKVVLTFSAAKFLRENLTTLLPTFEQARKDGN